MALAAPLPTGAVTFAFTDIEGSTARWDRDRAAMQEAVRRHDAILRTAITEHGGYVFKTMGDAFCAAFAQPEEAIAAMLAAQQALSSEDFSAVDGLRVRAAIHTGAADQRDGDYFGPPLNKAARLLAIGHGSQVLITSETATLVEGALADASLRELGAYRLKDFTEPQRVYQLLAPTLAADFPPLRSLGTLPSDASIVDTAHFRPAPTFSGRDAELAAVDAALQRESPIVIVHGLGGVGKSSVAREYGWRNRETYSVVWWLNAQTEGGIIDGLLGLGAMFVQGLDKLDDRRAAAKRVVNSVLGGFDKPVLLVFDNLEDEGLMRTWLPRTARALATSRDTAWSTDVTAIPLSIWALDTAADYLLRASGRSDLSAASANAISQALGALPLALSHAAAALRNLRMVSPQRYLEHISEHLKNAPRGAEYPHSVFATFSTAIAQAEQQAPGAAAGLCFAAAFAPDAIPEELFRQAVEGYAERLRPTLPGDGTALDLRSVIADEMRLDEALGALDRLSLLTFSESSRTYSMHRLVQLAAQDLAGEGALSWRQCAVAVADSAFPNPLEYAAWALCERLLPHARTAVDALPGDTAFLPNANLAHRCSMYLRRRDDYSAAEQLEKRALAIRERLLGPDHADVATSLHTLAAVYWSKGRYDEALTLLARALAIKERALGPAHPSVADSLNNMAHVYRVQGRFDEAAALHTRALAIRERAFGLDHPNVTMSLFNLGTVYSEQGRYDEAVALYRRALTIREKALGPDDPGVARCLNSMGSVFGRQGRYDDQTIMLYTRALAIEERALGPDHTEVALCLNNLACAYVAHRRYEEAEALVTRALEINERAHGPDHEATALTLDTLARTYVGQKRYDEAERLLARSLIIVEHAFGPNHPRIADSLHSLALRYLDAGRYDEAQALLTRALKIREKSLGLNHPETKATRDAFDRAVSSKA